MARRLNNLTVKQCESGNLKFGRHKDGGGLYLKVAAGGSKSWTFMWNVNGKRREVGLGSYPMVSLADARATADAYRKSVAAGRDPTLDRTKEAEKTFGEIFDQYVREREHTWKNEVHRKQWKRSAQVECKSIRDKPVSGIGQDEVLSVLKPLWSKIPETASRLRGRLDLVLEYCIAHRLHPGPNPAMWRTLKAILPPQKKSEKHHAALPFVDVPKLMTKLKATKDSISARGLEFTILTAARSGEVKGATWQEIDLDAALWTIPASRMKAGREHTVPLSARCVEILKEMGADDEPDSDAFIFPGGKRGKPLSSMAFDMQLRRLEYDHITTHGFRSSFRDWCGDHADIPREIAEQCLAHAVGSAVERAYRRGHALEKRREVMRQWHDYVTTDAPQDVRKAA